MTEIETAVGSAVKVTCSKDELTRALSVVGRAVSTRASGQVLGGGLLRGGEGAVVAPGRLLVALARLLPDSEVVLEHRPEQGVLEITCGPAAYKLNTYSAEDFPKLPEVEGAHTFTVGSGAFLDTVTKVARAASRDESRPVLTGVLVHFEGSNLIMAATDSYRMSVKTTEREEAAGAEREAVVPARALTELSRIAQDAAELLIGVQENHVVFGTGDIWLTTRRIDGECANHKVGRAA